jgi:TonB family protein
MPTRVLAPPSPSLRGFPRWGYLDKYAVNEYLPRAFTLTVAIVLSLGAALKVWLGPPGEADPRRPVRNVIFGSGLVDLEPPPTIVTPIPRTRRDGRSTTKGLSVPVPVPSPATDFDPIGSGSGTSTVSEGLGETGIEFPEVEGRTGVGSGWPSPDDIVVVEHEPVLIAMRAPVYPEIARDAGIEGTVLVRLLVDVQGTVREAQILQSVLGLDEAALAAASTAVFRPALQQDRPVAVWVVVPIDFQLH